MVTILKRLDSVYLTLFVTVWEEIKVLCPPAIR